MILSYITSTIMANSLLSYTNENTYIFSDFYNGPISLKEDIYIGLIDFLKDRTHFSKIFDNRMDGGCLGPLTIMWVADLNFYLTINMESGTRRFFMIVPVDNTDNAPDYYMNHSTTFNKCCTGNHHLLMGQQASKQI